MDKDSIADIIERTARAMNVQTSEGYAHGTMTREQANLRTAITGEFFRLADEFRKGLSV